MGCVLRCTTRIKQAHNMITSVGDAIVVNTAASGAEGEPQRALLAILAAALDVREDTLDEKVGPSDVNKKVLYTPGPRGLSAQEIANLLREKKDQKIEVSWAGKQRFSTGQYGPCDDGMNMNEV